MSVSPNGCVRPHSKSQALKGDKFINHSHMLKVENFTHGACERLLKQGYTHFVIKYRVDKEEIGAHCNVITFEAIRGSKVKAAIPISQVMDLPDGTATKYYVMHTTDEPTSGCRGA